MFSRKLHFCVLSCILFEEIDWSALLQVRVDGSIPHGLGLHGGVDGPSFRVSGKRLSFWSLGKEQNFRNPTMMKVGKEV